MERFSRFLHQPAMPLGKNRSFVTGSRAHWAAAKEAAIEGTVLLKNSGVLPLPKNSRVCLFGRGVGDYLYGGGGSGRVYTDREISLADALEAANQRGELFLFPDTISFYRNYVEKERAQTPDPQYAMWAHGNPRFCPALPEELYEKAVAFGGIAILIISRFSTENTINGDRLGCEGDYYLWPEEQRLLQRLTVDFDDVVVVLNVCGPVSTAEFAEDPRVGAVLYPMFGGGIAGEAVCDILLGKAYPSGHLQDTLARHLTDYPSTANYNESEDYVNYDEDIFVGYRYFESFAPEKVVYPFGFGLSYTDFRISCRDARFEKHSAYVTVDVENTGKYPGKEVIQLYLSAPQGKLGKAKKVLCAFQKTRELLPGDRCAIHLRFDLREFASYDDLGKIYENAFLLEAGEYTVHCGTNVRNTQPCLQFSLPETVICKKCRGYMAPTALPRRLTADGTYETLPVEPAMPHPIDGRRLPEKPEAEISLHNALCEAKLPEFIASLSDEDICDMLFGHPTTNIADTNGIGLLKKQKRDIKKVPLVPTADGPAGLRAIQNCGIYTTFFPCANVVAQTWNPRLAQKIGIVGAREVKENNCGIWLTPGMNIHRNPMCGRNFEYYSEDPLATGLFAAATVKGIQSQNIAATVKHFCCNNKEVNRKCSDSRVSMRALREIYLRGFEIAVKKADPWCLMTSYNLINGVQASTNWESITGILRKEWGYRGLVMTDWWAFSHIEDEIHAGSDVKMPEHITYKYPERREPYALTESLQDGTLDRRAVNRAIYNILKMMGHFE